MSFELLTKDELLEKISYKYQFSEIHQDENIKNTILNNYDKKYISKKEINSMSIKPRMSIKKD